MRGARRRTVLRVVAAALFAVFVARVLAFVLHEPMLGYGNNYDQVRYTACVDVYPHRPGVDPGLYSPEAPLVEFSRQPGIAAPCVWSTEWLALAPTAAWIEVERAAGGDGVVSIRPVGFVKAVAYLLACGLGVALLAMRRREPAAIGVAASAAVVGADPALLLWANTFYAEFLGVVALVVCVVLLLHAWAGGAGTARGRVALALAMPLAALALALAKVQYGPLPLSLALGIVLASIALRSERRRALFVRIAPFALGALAGLAVQLAALTRADDPALPLWRRVSTFNTVFNGVLQASSDPARTAARLGLPPECAALAGRTIFDYARREEWETVCPAVFDVGRVRMVVTLATREPATLARLAVLALDSLDPWVQTELGHVAGEKYGDATATHPSLAPWLAGDASPGIGAVVLSCAWAIFGLALALAARRIATFPATRSARASPHSLALPAAWLAFAVIAQQLLLTALGDGVHDLSRQAFLVHAAGLAFLVAGLAASLAALAGRPRAAPLRSRV